MSIQESAVGRATARRRREANVLPFGGARQSSPEHERATAFQGVYVGPWGASPAAPAENTYSKVLRQVDRFALGMTYGAVVVLWPFAFCFLVGLV